MKFQKNVLAILHDGASLFLITNLRIATASTIRTFSYIMSRKYNTFLTNNKKENVLGYSKVELN